MDRFPGNADVLKTRTFWERGYPGNADILSAMSAAGANGAARTKKPVRYHVWDACENNPVKDLCDNAGVGYSESEWFRAMDER